MPVPPCDRVTSRCTRRRGHPRDNTSRPPTPRSKHHLCARNIMSAAIGARALRTRSQPGRPDAGVVVIQCPPARQLSAFPPAYHMAMLCDTNTRACVKKYGRGGKMASRVSDICCNKPIMPGWGNKNGKRCWQKCINPVGRRCQLVGRTGQFMCALCGASGFFFAVRIYLCAGSMDFSVQYKKSKSPKIVINNNTIIEYMPIGSTCV